VKEKMSATFIQSISKDYYNCLVDNK